MKPFSGLILGTLASIVVYWAVILLGFESGLSLQEAFAKNMGHGLTATVLFGFLGLLAYFFLPKHSNTQETPVAPKTLHDVIVSLIFSPAPFGTKLEKTVERTVQALDIEHLFIVQYHGESLKVLHQNKTSHPLQETLMLSGEAVENPLEKELLLFPGRKTKSHLATLPLQGKNHSLALVSLQAEHLLKPSGAIGALFSKGAPSPEALETLAFLGQNLAFALSLVEKKEAILRANERQVEQLADEDPQLGIFTNLKLRQIILYEIKRNQRHKTDLSLLLFGIDHFENLSGILTSEQCLGVQKELASLVKSNLRNTDIFGTWDENVFAVVLPDLAFQSANALSRKLGSLIAKKRFEGAGKITCSFGITTFISPEDTIETFRRRAESALQKAHQEGGDRTEIKLLVSPNHKAH